MQRKEWAVLAAGMVAYAAIVLAYVNYVPIWDGRIYADCILAAADRLWGARLSCGGHNAHAYVLVLALAAKVLPSGTSGGAALVIGNAALGLVALAALARVLQHLLPGRDW